MSVYAGTRGVVQTSRSTTSMRILSFQTLPGVPGGLQSTSENYGAEWYRRALAGCRVVSPCVTRPRQRAHASDCQVPYITGSKARHPRGVRWLLRRRTTKCRDLPASRPERPGQRARSAGTSEHSLPALRYRRPVSIRLALPPRHGKSLSRCAKTSGPRPARPARHHPGRRPVGPTRSLLARARVGRSHGGRR